MSNISQEIIFPGSGLNTDDSLEFIDLGSSPYRLNILVSEDGASGVITNMKGNHKAANIADYQLALSDSYEVIASYYNRLTRKAYFFVWGSPYDSGGGVYIYDNKLFAFNEDTETLDLIFTDTKNWFAFEFNTPVRDLDMIGDWLYFNTKVSEPKMVDVLRAYNYTNYNAYDTALTYVFGNTVHYRGGLFTANTNVAAGQTPATTIAKWDRVGDAYSTTTGLAFDSEFEYAFNVIKMPPTIRPTLAYGSDTHIKANNVRGKIFRFAYRYKYFDNSYSVYSAYSDVTLPEDDELYNGEIINNISFRNYIQITYYPHAPALVKEIEVIYQEIEGPWKRVKVINRQEQSLLNTFGMSFNFYNNESYIEVDPTKATKVEDSVPQKANAQAIINKNILAFGGTTEGFNNIPKDEIDVTLIPYVEAISTAIIVGATKRNNLTAGDIVVETGPTGEGGNVYIRIGTWWNGGVAAGDVYTITLDGVTSQVAMTASDVANKVTAINHLISFIGASFPAYNTGHKTGDNDYIAIAPRFGHPVSANVTQSIFASNGGASSSINKKKGFKTGSNHPFCIFYYDENLRRWDAQVSKENTLVTGWEMNGTTVYVPMFSEITPALTSTANRIIIDWEVNHLPPTGAKYWKWGYAGNSLCGGQMVQYILGSALANSVTDPDGSNMVKIDITPLQTLKNTTTTDWNQFPSSVIDPYEWQKGDRIRFITQSIAAGPATVLGVMANTVLDYEILKTDETGMFLFIQGSIAGNGLTLYGVNSLVEIYSPLKSLTDTKTIYYEFGDMMAIIEDSDGVLVHQGQDGVHNQDTLLGQPASGTFNGGDVYHITRTPSKPINTGNVTNGAFHESMWYSDFYNSDDYDRGKIGFETNFGQRFLNIVRYSNQYLQNTLINGLSTFDESSTDNNGNQTPHYKELNDIYGDIKAIMEQGDTLKVYQERKASSILIGRTEYMDATGNVSVAISDRVLGAIRYSPSNYTTLFSESLSRNNKYIYGYDLLNGVIWRDSVNGLFPISGRYAQTGGDADYKMQTYFKLKSKALMISGIENVSVLSVWDEEYKNLYVTFKDRVDADNNDTVVFHEPSNRWICFTEFNQTPIGGYVTPLEPTYSILRGFESGLGYSFNEETRFSHFDLSTPAPPVDNNTYIVDEDNTTFIIDEDNSTSIIE